MKIIRYITLITFLFLQFPISGQENLIRNGGFNGELGDRFPYEWMGCVNDFWNDPTSIDIFRANDLNDNTIIRPINGERFMKLRARGIYIRESPTVHPKETREYLSQLLDKPLEKYTNYKFTVFLCFYPSDWFDDSVQPNIGHPMKLDVLVGNTPCDQERLLLETPVIDNTTWQEQTFYFNTLNEPFQYLKLQVQWDDKVLNYHYNGLMLLDSARIVKDDCVIDTSIVDVLFKGDGLTQLDAGPENDVEYEWFPKENLSNDKIKAPLVTSFTPRCYVVIKRKNNCPAVKIFNLQLNCHDLYPTEILDTTNVIYRKDQKVILSASSKGKSFQWDNSTYLSSDTAKSPFLKGYAEQFIVTATDKYNCKFKQLFKVKIDCDLLNPKKEIVMLDTIVNEGVEVPLIPKYGTIVGNWEPTLYLKCGNCQSAMSYPKTNIEYGVNLFDEFKCPHSEIFKISVLYSVPNFISPNGDGHNDCLHISGLPEKTILKIFDKSGKLIYSASPYNNENKCWAGFDNDGKMVESGTYWYTIDYPGLKSVQKGFVFLKR